jgi:hypothetical protein
MLELLDRDSQLLFAVHNRQGEVATVFKAIRRIDLQKAADDRWKALLAAARELVDGLSEAGVDSPQVEALGGTGRISGADTLEFALTVRCEDGDAAQELGERLAALFSQLGPELGIEVLDSSVEGAVARVQLERTGLQELIRGADEWEQRPPEPAEPD